MTDIAKCDGMSPAGQTVCPKRFECWRYHAPAGFNQSWITAPFTRDVRGIFQCDMIITRSVTPLSTPEQQK
jgi:hypothetical protein